MTDEYCKYEHDHPEQIPHEHGEIVECLNCPAEWEVLVDDLSGELELVRTEVTQPETWYHHPLAKGIAAIVIGLGVILGPVFVGAHLAEIVYLEQLAANVDDLWITPYFVGVMSVAVSWILSYRVGKHTPVNHWVWMFDRWNDTRYRRKED